MTVPANDGRRGEAGPTLSDWVAGRTPPAPAELLAHVRRDLDARRPGVPSLLDAAVEALERVLSAPGTARDTALDLLSADAYVTYAFEAAASDPGSLVRTAEGAMRRVSAVAARHLESGANGP